MANNVWHENSEDILTTLQNATKNMQEKRRLDLEQQIYQQQADQNKQNQIIEKLRIFPTLVQGMQNAGLEVTPDVISKLSTGIGLSGDVTNVLQQMNPMTITQTDAKGNQTEVPINKVTAQYQATVAKGDASYRRGTDIQAMKSDTAENVARIRNQGMIDKINAQIKANPNAANDKTINAMLGFIIRSHNNGMQPSDVDAALQNLHEAVNGINNNAGENAPNPNAPAINAPKAGMFNLGKYNFTQGDVINKAGGSKILDEVRGGRTLQADLQQANTYLNQYKDNPKAQDIIVTNFKKKWPEMSTLLGGK